MGPTVCRRWKTGHRRVIFSEETIDYPHEFAQQSRERVRQVVVEILPSRLKRTQMSAAFAAVSERRASVQQRRASSCRKRRKGRWTRPSARSMELLLRREELLRSARRLPTGASCCRGTSRGSSAHSGGRRRRRRRLSGTSRSVSDHLPAPRRGCAALPRVLSRPGSQLQHGELPARRGAAPSPRTNQPVEVAARPSSTPRGHRLATGRGGATTRRWRESRTTE
jgi:hypothetical protein